MKTNTQTTSAHPNLVRANTKASKPKERQLTLSMKTLQALQDYQDVFGLCLLLKTGKVDTGGSVRFTVDVSLRSALKVALKSAKAELSVAQGKWALRKLGSQQSKA